MATYKEQLSKHVEGIFKSYTEPGLHICDIATGGGKSYTIGKLTCEYYPNEFDRIIILCVQNKLVDSMNREIDRFINGGNSQISPINKMVIENNPEVIIKAVNNSSFQRLLDRICYHIGEQKQKGNYSAPIEVSPIGMRDHLTVLQQQELHCISNFRSSWRFLRWSVTWQNHRHRCQFGSNR